MDAKTGFNLLIVKWFTWCYTRLNQKYGGGESHWVGPNSILWPCCQEVSSRINGVLHGLVKVGRGRVAEFVQIVEYETF